MFSIFFSLLQFFQSFLYFSLFVPLCFLYMSLFFHVCFFTFHDCVSLSSFFLFFCSFVCLIAFFHSLFTYCVIICHVFLYYSFFYHFKFNVVERRVAQMHFSVF